MPKRFCTVRPTFGRTQAMNTETNDTDPTADGSAADRQHWELRKLKAEAIKAEFDADHAKSTGAWAKLEKAAPWVTVLIAVVSLGVTGYQDGVRRKTDGQNRREDQFIGTVREFGEAETIPTKLAVITELESFAKDTAFRPRIQSLVLAAALAERDNQVRAQIRDLIVRTGDRATLHTLATQNRMLQQLLSSAAARADNASEVYVETRLDPDSRAALTNLGWNITVMRDVLERMRVVEKVDLSHVTFTRLYQPLVAVGDAAEVGDGAPIPLEDRLKIANVVFNEVNLTSANLAHVSLENCEFKNVRLDSAFVGYASFYKSTLDRQTSLTAFRTGIAYDDVERGLLEVRRYPVFFTSSTIDAARFTALKTPGGRYDPYFKTVWTKWNIADTKPGKGDVELYDFPKQGSGEKTGYDARSMSAN
jgi:hypothetical protein